MQTIGQEFEIKIDDLKICYEDYGSGEIPLICIHGFPFDKSSWHAQLDFFRTTHRVIAFDIRGFGKSIDTTKQVSMDIFARDLIRLMDALHIRQAIPCGLSMGGYIVLNAVQHYPERFNAIVLCDTQCIADSEDGREKRYKTIEQIEKNGLKDFADTFLEKIFSAKSLQEKNNIIEKIRNIILHTPVHTITRTLMALAERAETASILADIKIPSLIVCGSEDSVTVPEQSEYLYQHISGSSYHLIDGAGHMSNIEQPAEFNRYLKNFLDRLNE